MFHIKQLNIMLGYTNIRSVVHIDFSERSVELMWRGSSSDFREFGYQDCIECSSLISSGCGSLLRSTFKVYIAGSEESISESQFESVTSDVEISAFVECYYDSVSDV